MGTTTATPDAFRAALPDVTSTFSLPGLDGPVEIVRDTLGIPHVRAGSRHDAFFAQGFVHAQDRLWQLEFDRRRGLGRWAECAGAAAVEWDAFARRMRLGATARADYAAFDADTRGVFDAYAAGVNAFISSTKQLPVEFGLLDITPEPWDPWHSCAVFKVRHVLMGVWGTKLWRARVLTHLGPELAVKLGTFGDHDGVLVVPPGAAYHQALADLSELQPGEAALAEAAELQGGSNNWAVHGTRTASGKPLVAGDPHRFLDTPNVYYQNHVACPEFDVIGYSFGGVPGFPHFAHNRQVAWCITHAMADYQDLYVERFKADDPSQYELQGEWRPAERSRETIGVRDGASVEIDVTRTLHGPVVIGDPASGHAITMRYTATDVPNPGLQCLLPMLLANNVAELTAAMRDWVDPCNNLIVADVHGDIAYLHRGRVPLRSKANAWLPVPGWNGEHEWHGNVPFDELPRLLNPDTGFIATANNRVVGPEYPYYLGLNYAPPFRATRVVARLSELRDATIADMAAVHADRLSLPSRTFVAALSGAHFDDARVQDALQRLRDWDNVMDKGAVAPSIYIALRDQLGRALLAQPQLAVLRQNPFAGEPQTISPEARLWAPIVTMLENDDHAILPEGRSWSDVLADALTRAVGALTEQLGPDMDAWQWGKLHTTNPTHPLAPVFPQLADQLNPPSVSIGGDGDTVQAAAIFPAQSFRVNGMSVTRYAFDTADWDKSAWVVPLGSSAHPASPHYADQAADWSEVQLRPMLYSWDKVEANAETTQRLEPEST
jgi:penicillin amidase